MKYKIILNVAIILSGIALFFRFIGRIMLWRTIALVAEDKGVAIPALLARNIFIASVFTFSIATVVIGIGLILYLYWNTKIQRKENISGLIFIAVISSFLSIVAWPFTFSIMGIIFGHISVFQSKLKHSVTNRMIAAALAIGYVSLILSVVYIVILYPYPVEIQEKIGEYTLFKNIK